MNEEEEIPRKTSYDYLREEISRLNHNLELLIVNQEHSHSKLETSISDLAVIVHQDHKILFRSNGTKGLIERVEDIEERHKEDRENKKAQQEDFRRIKASVLSAAALLALDLVIRIIPIMGQLLQEITK